MNRVKCAGALALAMVCMTAGTASAQQPQPCAMMKDHQMGGMGQQGMPGMGMGMMNRDKQDKEMGGMQGCKMMDDMKKQHQLLLEMKKHMRMMDEMMEMMVMPRQQGMTPPGSGSEPQEHHPGEGK
ncbi:MAG: hypothetical protein HYY11_03820 [Candidatus Methylomirabilis oxyfera]|nr:hypothetical protein [Candidatus Methylomirabilis oxyfera]